VVAPTETNRRAQRRAGAVSNGDVIDDCRCIRPA
jgi:hypothetical protein